MKGKQTEGKCQRRPPRASNRVIHFPTDVIFSNRKRPEVGISQEVLTVTHWAFCGGRENNFSSQILTVYHIFTVGFPLIWELAATFRALQTPGATRRIFPSSQDAAPGSTFSSPACPSTQPGWGWLSFLRCWNLLLPSNQANKENPPFALCGLAVWQHNNPSLEKVKPEAGRKIFFNSLLT